MGLGGGATFVFSRKARALSVQPKPNIIFILADDMGLADCSCYGATHIKTPAIDSLAKNGALLSQAYANSAVCTASRVAIITGRYQYRVPIGLEEPLDRSKQLGLPPGHPTLPSALKEMGYRTHLIGKWHLGPLPNFDPLKSGYDYFYGFERGSIDYFDHPELREDYEAVGTPGYLTELLGRRAVEIVHEQFRSRAPQFMSLHFSAPHWPWEDPGDEAESKRLTGKSKLHYDGGTLQTYVRMVEAMDRQIGLLLEALEQTGQAENTIVLFTSDNGGERFSNTWPFTGKKEELLEGGIRVPALISWPGKIPKGLVIEQTAIHMDWLPTFLAASGEAHEPKLPSDGINLLPFLVDGADPINRTLFWRYKANAQRAVREGNYKALKIAGNTFLFDVVNDPLERANLKARLPETYLRLTGKWNEWNRTMLPQIPESATSAHSGSLWADHITALDVDPTKIDDGGPWPQ